MATPEAAVETLYRRRFLPGRRESWRRSSPRVIALLVLVAILAPLIAPNDPNAVDLGNTLADPSKAHLLGTDASGRDILSRLIYGTRTSLLGPLLVVRLSTLVGVTLGLLAGTGGAGPTACSAACGTCSSPSRRCCSRSSSSLPSAPGSGRRLRDLDRLRAPPRQGRARRRARRAGEGLRRRLQGAGLQRLPRLAAARAAERRPDDCRAVDAQLRLRAPRPRRPRLPRPRVQPPTADWGQMLTDGRESLILRHYSEVISASVAIAVTVVCFNLVGDALSQRAGSLGEGPSARAQPGHDRAPDRGAPPRRRARRQLHGRPRGGRRDRRRVRERQVHDRPHDPPPASLPGRARGGGAARGRDLLAFPKKALREVRAKRIAMIFQDPRAQSTHSGQTAITSRRDCA